MMSEFYQYLSAVFAYWWALIPGGILAVDSAAEYFIRGYRLWLDRFISRELRQRIIFSVALLGVFFAGFLAWHDQYRANIVYQQERDSPATKLIAETDEHFALGWGEGRWILFVLLNVTNVGKNQSIARKFELNVACPDKNDLAVQPATPPPKSKLSTYGLEPRYEFRVMADEYIENRMMNQSIVPGNLVRGWLVFFEVEINTPLNCKYILNFQDTFGRIYFLTLPSIEKIPPTPKRLINYPGITTPFVPKSVTQEKR